MRRNGLSRQQEYLCDWIDERPGQRKYRGRTRKRVLSHSRRRYRRWPSSSPATEPLRRSPRSTALSRTAPYVWRREITGDNVGDAEEKGVPVSKEYDDLPDDIEVLQDMLREAKMQLRKVQLELDVRQATLEIVKKTRAPTQSC